MRAGTEEILREYTQAYGFVNALEAELRRTVEILERSFRAGGKLLICGNGGSCADADHIVGELLKSFRIHRPLDPALKAALTAASGIPELAEKLEGGLPAINLGAHTALMTALLNDVGGEYLFAQQVIGYGKPGDVLLGISTSGNSKDILYAGAAAKAMGLATVALTGRSGGKMKDCFDLAVCVPGNSTEEIQDRHSTVYHILCAALEYQFWGE